jgi:hypothetical protein
MKFIYMGFRHDTTDVRLYSFEGVPSEGTRKAFLVTADLALLARHHVRIQDAPMLCLRLLETSAEANPQRELLVLTEGDMLAHARAKAEEAEKAAARRAKRPFRPSPPAALGTAWRS